MHGHIVSFSGDSGSPLWIEDNGKNYLIAVLATGLEDDNEAGGYFSMNRHTCRNAVTKITQEMKKWFFDKHYEYWFWCLVLKLKTKSEKYVFVFESCAIWWYIQLRNKF